MTSKLGHLAASLSRRRQGRSYNIRLVNGGRRPSRVAEIRDAISLSFVPFGFAIAFGVLLLPRRVVPEAVPVPIADLGAIARTAAADHELAESARREPLAGAVRALGSAIRRFHTLEAADEADPRDLADARREVDTQLASALESGDRALLQLRAVQLEGFLDEVRRFESTGVESPELAALAGAFLRSMRAEGWCRGHTLLASPAALRGMYKEMWNRFLALDVRPPFEPSLDERRAVFALYLSEPHPSPKMRETIAASRRGARDAEACKAVAASERRAIERWRLDHIARLAAFDPSYPADYARGVASYRAGDYVAAAEAFRAWLNAHPDGPFSLRAEGYLRAAAGAARLD
jgi:hypothetical protein